MSPATTEDARPASQAIAVTATGQSATARWRTWRIPVAIVIFVLLAGTAIALLQPSQGALGHLSPDGKGPDGTHALADILGARGVSVRTVTTVADATGAASAATTLVITSPFLLSTGQLRELGRTRARLVIVEPDQAALDELAPQVSLSGGGPVSVLVPGCPLRAATLAGPASMGGSGLVVQPGTADVAQCYVARGLATLVQLRSGGRPVTVVSSGAAFSNQYLASEGDAALAMNLLSARSQVVWLVPQFLPAAGTGGSSRSLASQVPLAAYLVAIQLGVALLLTALWRARRLGPLITEPLPVVVRASETVEGHARLYRSRRARDRVAATLRGAAVARLLPMLGLPPRAPAAAVIAAVSARSAREPARIDALLYGPPPTSDAELVTLASDLDALEGEVRS